MPAAVTVAGAVEGTTATLRILPCLLVAASTRQLFGNHILAAASTCQLFSNHTYKPIAACVAAQISGQATGVRVLSS